MSILKTLAIYLIITFQFWLLKSSLILMTSSNDLEDDSLTRPDDRASGGSSLGTILSHLVRTIDNSHLNTGPSLEGKF